MGGENVLAAPMIVLTWGSSPRGRGKPSRCPSSQTPRRLIPAWAGKTVPPVTLPGYQGAHPRVGGENANRDNKYQLQKGSSPRGRGKLVPCAGIPGVAGLIPAWAGKTRLGTLTTSRSRAHPRVGGENSRASVGTLLGTGSSPRGRGKPHGARLAPGVSGLIPAWAGKTCKSNPYVLGVRAHPRVGGENLEGVVYVRQTLGSSPRGRGKPVSLHLEEGTGGLIPAWAGKTCCCVCALFAHRAHPRVGGENSPPTPARRRFSGSSPRGRGKLVILPFLIVSHRLIPAWAGKTILSPGLNCAHRAHPRVGGENGQGDGLSAVARGSSPRGRGKLVVVVLGVVEFRLIPAWAGKTTSSTPSRRRSRAHPRVGGENLDLVHTDLYVPGSSPRGRGKPRH